MNLTDIHQTAISVCDQAANLLPQNFQSSGLETKGHHRDVVTEFDRLVDQFISEKLKLTDYDVISEELNSEFDLNKADHYWCVDPIDGTVNFAQGMDYYAICVGLAKLAPASIEFVSGAVNLPARKEFFFTTDNNQAYCNGKRLTTSDTPLSESLFCACFSSNSTNQEVRTKEFELFHQLNDSSRGIMRLGSAAVQICYTAKGHFQGCFGLRAKLWDVVAPLSIAQFAGASLKAKLNGDGTVNFLVGTPTAVGHMDQAMASMGLWS